MTFIYATCTDTCPLLTAKMAGMQKRLGPDFGPRVRFVSITVDPERDTPEILTQYARNHGVESGGLGLSHGHTGRDPGRRAAATASMQEECARRRRSHLPDLDRRPARDAPRPVPRHPLRSRGVPAGRPEPPARRRRPRDPLAPQAGCPPAAEPSTASSSFAFLAIVGLLIAVGAVGLQVLSGVNRRAEDMVKLQRKIAAYRQLQHDTTSQLYGVSSASSSPTTGPSRRPSAS